MKIKLSANQFFDNEGKPLSSGRISVFLHDSDTRADIAIMNGDSYYAEMNPMTCDEAGRVPSVYFDACIVDVLVEKPNGDGTYELQDTYQDGFAIPQGTSESLVYGIAQLKNVNPSAGMVVNVVGYDSDVFAPSRFYVYDPSATDTADDGAVIASDHGDGRWLLLWDNDSLPCTVYGVNPGHEANIGAFLDFPDHLGQWDIRTPSKCRFIEGDYTSNTLFSTTRCIKFDAGARFLYAAFQVPCIETEQCSNFIADFYFQGGVQDVAESGWFKTFDSFLTCNAKTLNFGADNFADKIITGVAAVTDKNITGRGRIAATYSSGAYIKLSNCNITAYKFLDPSNDKVQILHSRWSDSWWTNLVHSNFDFGTMANGNRLEFTTSKNDKIVCSDFTNANIYVKAMVADLTASPLTASKKLDLEGKSVNAFDGAGFEEIRNAIVTGLLKVNATNVSLYNVKAASLKATCTYLYLHDNCVVDIADGSAITYFLCNDSKITRGTAWDICPIVNAYKCEWSVPMQPATDNTTDCNAAGFTECYIHDVTFKHKHLTFNNCNIVNCNVQVYPYVDGTSKIAFNMNGCIYNSANPLYIGRFIDNTDATGKNVEASVCIADNVFIGNSKGITMPFYALVTNKSLFLKSGLQDGFVYHGNGGICPKDSAQASFSEWGGTTSYDTAIIASGYASVEFRAFTMQSSNSAKTTLAFNRWTQEYTLTNSGQDISADGKTGSHIVHSVQLSPFADEEHNDYFSLRYFTASNPNKTIVLM